MDIRQLRTKVNELQNKVAFEQQVGALAALKKVIPELDCEIVVEKAETPDDYICHLHTLWIDVGTPLFYRRRVVIPIVVADLQKQITDTSVFRDLESNNLITAVESIIDADMIVYLKTANGRDAHIHSGRVRDGKVISKWGKGHIWQHDPHHVPSVYENDDGEIRYLLYKSCKTSSIHSYLGKHLVGSGV